MTKQTDAQRLWECFHFPGTKFNPPILGQPPTTISRDCLGKIRVLKDKEIVFSVFNTQHAEIAREAIRLLTAASTFRDFVQCARFLQTITNPDFYNYVLTVAALIRPDTRNHKLPTAIHLQPHQFFPVIHRIPKYLHQASGTDVIHIVIKVDETGTDLDPEHRVAYFREDIGANSHHWHWHVVYPWNSKVIRHRQGELFYYMHRQMLARYDSERLSVGWGLKRVKPLEDWDKPIKEGYAPHLTTGSGEPYAFRVPGMKLASVVGSASLKEMTEYRTRILKAIKDGHFRNGVSVCIDMLGAAVEHNTESPDMAWYGGKGGIHNYGHDLLAKIQDPDGRYKNNNPGGVMGHTETAIRDPVFFRWHKFIDNMFEEYKRTLNPYTSNHLSYPNFQVNRVEITNEKGETITNIETFMKNKTFQIIYGLDFSPSAKTIQVTMPHLDHDEFEYKLALENTTARTKKVTIRIFLTPKLNDSGFPVSMEEYRTLCIEMDKFTHNLVPGKSNVRRRSIDSSVTIGWDNILGSLNEKNTPAICGCGWPHHLLLPRGKTAEEGVMKFSLFVMLTDWQRDQVEGAVRSTKTECEQCDNAASYCGVLDGNYPDARAMGFPFDRPISAESLDKFIGDKQNMKMTEIQITHKILPLSSQT